MAVLHYKLARELFRNAGTLITVVGIIAVGAGCLIGLGSAVRILAVSQRDYYQAYRFADFWIHVKKAPQSAVERIAALDGVADVEGRVVFDVLLDVVAWHHPGPARSIERECSLLLDCFS